VKAARTVRWENIGKTGSAVRWCSTQLYKSNDGTLLNADANGAYNILRKTDSDFSFSKLAKKVGAKLKEWLHPTKRIHPLPTWREPFFIDLKSHRISKQKMKSNLSFH
jgi:hypothetical protein